MLRRPFGVNTNMSNDVRTSLLARVARATFAPTRAPDRPASILSLAAASYGARPSGDATVPTGFDPMAVALFEALIEGAYLVANADGVFDAEERRAFEHVVLEACGGTVPPHNVAVLVGYLEAHLKKDGVGARIREIATIVNWTDPGPGGFYDDLGNTRRQPHLVRGIGLAGDPGFYETPRVGFITGRRVAAHYPISWWDSMESLYDAPLRLHYDELDPRAAYSVRIAYAGDSPSTKIRLLADEKYVVHPEITKPRPAALVEFDVSREATRDGHLTLTWYRQAGLGGNGRGCAVADVWLIKKRP